MSDLGTYGDWMDLISTCEPATPSQHDKGPAWWITLRAKVGPFARSKQLRMVRTDTNEPHHVVFSRSETDGKSHSDWVMQAIIEPTADGSVVTVDLSYSGGLWSGPLDAVLGAKVDSAVPRLREYVSA